MNLKAYLGSYALKADKAIDRLFDAKIKEAEEIDGEVARAFKILQNYMAGGKKIRGALTVLGYEMAGGKNLEAILPVSIAIEIVHSSLLIHDDFIDGDQLRRGRKTVHRLYAEQRTSHYGASMALVLGDTGFFVSQQILANSNFDPKRVARAMSEFDRLLMNTGYGQLLDIAYDYKKKITWNDIQKVRIYKTAHYTFVMPLVIGATLAGAGERELKAIEKYGEPVGIAFQIQDDILGTFGNSKITGKSNESDIREGKRTFLYLKAIELAGKEDKNYLEKWYGAKRIKKENIKKIKEIMQETGAIDSSSVLALELVNQGKKQIPNITRERKYQAILGELADYIISRDK